MKLLFIYITEIRDLKASNEKAGEVFPEAKLAKDNGWVDIALNDIQKLAHRPRLYPCSSHKPIDPIVNFVRPTGDAPGPSNGVDEPSREVDESSNKSNKSNDASVETSDRSTSPKGKSSKPTEQSDGSDESSDSSDASSGEPDDPNNGSSASDNEKDGSPCSKKSASGNSKVSRTLIASRHRANTNRNTYPTPGPSRYASRRQNSQALAAGADYEDDNL